MSTKSVPSVSVRKVSKSTRSKTRSKTHAKVSTVEPVAEKNKAVEAITLQTTKTGVISFVPGSGSQDVLNLVAKFGFNKEKVEAEALKMKKAGKAFVKSDPVKKIRKMFGVIKRQQNAGFKLPSVA